MKLALLAALALSANAAIVNYTVSVGLEEGTPQQPVIYAPANGSFDTNVGIFQLLVASTGAICCDPFYPSIVSGTVNVSDGHVVPFHLTTYITKNLNGTVNIDALFSGPGVRKPFGPVNFLADIDPAQGFVMNVVAQVVPEPGTWLMAAVPLAIFALRQRVTARR